MEFIKQEKERGKTILLSSHIFGEVDATCDKIAIIKDGKIVSDFVANDLKHASEKKYKIGFADSSVYEKFLRTFEHAQILDIIEKNPSNYAVTIATDDKYISEVINSLSKYPLKDFTHIKETLEDYFMQYYKEDKDYGGALH